MFRSHSALTFFLVSLTLVGQPLPAHAQGPAVSFRLDTLRAATAADAPPVARAPEPAVLGREVGIWLGVLGAGLGSSAVGDPSPLDCSPCDRGDVPFFDRWAIARSQDTWSLASTVALFAAAGVSWATTLPEARGFSRFGASIESAALAISVTELLKNAAGRRRPYTYVSDDLTALDPFDSKRSWPSGHTSAAFAVAASHWLSHRGDDHRVSRTIVGLAALAAGTLRIPAGRHFPTDVISGAGVGIASALLVHTIRF